MIKRFLWFVFAIGLLFSSCNSYKNLTYLEGIDKSPRDSLYVKQKTEYVIQPHDNLYIRIQTGNEETDDYYNQSAMGGNNMSSNMMQGGNMYMMGYYVSDTGTIEMPVLGILEVAGKSLVEIKRQVEQEVAKYLNDAFVIVKAPGFSYSTMGEIGYGKHTFEGEELHILDVLAASGGISDYGIRNNVIIIRQQPEGMYSFTVDLTEDDILGNPDFYIMPNDIIYVKPMKVRIFRVRSGDVLGVLGTFTSLISIVLLIITLNNN